MKRCPMCRKPAEGVFDCIPCARAFDSYVEARGGVTPETVVSWAIRRVRRLDAKRRTDSAKDPK